MKNLLTFFKDKILLSLLALVILSTIIGNIIANYCGIDMSDSMIQHLLSSNLYLVTLLVVIIVPVIEELAFRGWIFKRQSLKIVSFILFAGFTLLSLKFFGIICVLLLFYSWFLDKNTQRRYVVLIILSSLVFAFVHHGNFEDIKPFLISFSTYLFVGLLLGYLAYKTQKINASIIVHILNNAVAMVLLLSYSPASDSEFTCEKEHFKIQVQKESIFKRSNTDSKTFDYLHITIPKLVTFFKPTQERVYINTVPSLEYYSVKITSTNGEPIDNAALADFLIDKFNLKTSVEQKKTVLYEVDIADTAKLLSFCDSESFSFSSPFPMFFESLGRYYQTPIHVSDSLLDKYSTIRLSYSIKKDMSFEKECENLLQKRGVKLYPNDSTFIEIITISY